MPSTTSTTPARSSSSPRSRAVAATWARPSWRTRHARRVCSPPGRPPPDRTGTGCVCSLVAAAAEGDRAPVLELPDTHGTPVRLGGARGRPQLVVFLPFAFSRVCGGELRDLLTDPVHG